MALTIPQALQQLDRVLQGIHDSQGELQAALEQPRVVVVGAPSPHYIVCEVLGCHPPIVARSAVELRQHLQATFGEDRAAIDQAETDQTALQTEARHAMRLEDERPEDELTGDQSADALGRALQGIKQAHDDMWPF